MEMEGSKGFEGFKTFPKQKRVHKDNMNIVWIT
jgi:hypothetical protein